MDDLTRIKRGLEAQGWEVTPTANGHWRFKGPEPGQLVFAPSTPSDYRSLANLRAELWRKGARLHGRRPSYFRADIDNQAAEVAATERAERRAERAERHAEHVTQERAASLARKTPPTPVAPVFELIDIDAERTDRAVLQHAVEAGLGLIEEALQQIIQLKREVSIELAAMRKHIAAYPTRDEFASEIAALELRLRSSIDPIERFRTQFRAQQAERCEPVAVANGNGINGHIRPMGGS